MSAFLILSLALNVAFFASEALLTFASGMASSITGTRSLITRQADDIARLQTDLDAERRINRELRQEATENASELAVERAARREVRAELTQTTSELAESRILRAQLQDATTDTAERMAKRAQRASIREISTMPAEAVPFWGTAVIVSASALEIYDLCQNLIDIHDLQLMFDQDAVPSEEQLTVCSLEVPSKDDVWDAARSAPGDVWLAAKEAMPTAETFQNLEMPDFDWSAIGSAIVERPQQWGAAARSAAGEKWGQVKDWWASD